MYQLLIVDDQPDLVEDLATMLPWSGIGIGNVYQAHSGAEALDIMKATPIDILITDIRMPGLSGLDLIETVRETWNHIKCILLSGYNDFEYAQRALKSQASDYLLKPVEDEELLGAVKRAIGELENRWREVSSHQSALATLRDNLPTLRSHLLSSLLRNDRVREDELMQQLSMMELSIGWNSPYCMMLLRMEDYFYEQSESDSSLLEYAVCNIAEEIFEDHQLWYVKDEYGYYVFLILPRPNLPEARMAQAMVPQTIEQKVAHLQHYVKLYLKGTVSLVLSKQGTFPEKLSAYYESLLGSFRQRIGGERDFLLTLSEEQQHGEGEANSLTQLYHPPLLNHLLEAGQWDGVSRKLDDIFEELERKRGDSHEHILETYYAVVSSLSYAVHKNKLWLSECLGQEFNQLLSGPRFHTIAQLRSWINDAIAAYKACMTDRTQDSRTGLIQKVQEYVSNHLADASLQSIADHVYLNPSYLSKVYKLETGEGISEYLSRLKMEAAAHMLRSSSDKIYEIAAKVGYQKTSYFIKVFKDRYGITPQDFRDR
ncbi:response regulator [Paenibacillus nanensis]|uniref:Response regulator n=1 Tax=Paenibacillus nanensis TaxID=393251 RepID=A0A3A1UTK2_9BACL|nr:response regulator [Paenibacillus nanensis]RIX50502.1 response regulator [Paenibacillus nanensis]